MNFSSVYDPRYKNIAKYSNCVNGLLHFITKKEACFIVFCTRSSYRSKNNTVSLNRFCWQNMENNVRWNYDIGTPFRVLQSFDWNYFELSFKTTIICTRSDLILPFTSSRESCADNIIYFVILQCSWNINNKNYIHMNTRIPYITC